MEPEIFQFNNDQYNCNIELAVETKSGVLDQTPPRIGGWRSDTAFFVIAH